MGDSRREPIIYLVQWEDDAAETYLYGTKLTFGENGTVLFCNEMMPSGMVIREWHSLVAYQEKRFEPQLPIMEAGENMVVRSRILSEPDNAVLLRVNFYDYHQELVSFTIIRGKVGSFTFPKGAYSYSLQLVEAGAQSIMFYRIELIPEGNDPYAETEDDAPYKIYNPSPKSRALNVLLPIENGRVIRAVDPDNLWNISNLVFAPPELGAPEPFFDDAFLRRKEWRQEWKNFTKINFIGCGEKEADAAYRLEYKVPDSHAVTVHSLQKLKELNL